VLPEPPQHIRGLSEHLMLLIPSHREHRPVCREYPPLRIDETGSADGGGKGASQYIFGLHTPTVPVFDGSGVADAPIPGVGTLQVLPGRFAGVQLISRSIGVTHWAESSADAV